jgi:hypothetical protein
MICDWFKVECDSSFCGCNRTREIESLLKEVFHELKIIASYKNDSRMNFGLKTTAIAYDKLCDRIKEVIKVDEQ